MSAIDPRIAETQRCFNEIYIEGLPLLIRDKCAFLSFVCVLTGIEALSGYRFEKGKLERRFKSFVEIYFPPEYKPLVADLWAFRKKMVHAFCPAAFALTHNRPAVHFTKMPDGRLILNAEDFCEAFQTATAKYFNELTLDLARQRAMLKRLDDLYNGGSIAVVALR